MRKTSLFTRSLAALLCFVMVLGMLPVFGMAPVAYAAEGDETTDETTEGGATTDQQTGPQGNYITLPITVRDFAADGMLFEYNEMGESTFTAGDNWGTIYDDGVDDVTWGDPAEYTITDRLYYEDDTPYAAVYNPSSTTFNVTSPTGIFIMPATYSWDFSGYLYWYCLIIDASGRILKVLPSETAKTSFATDIEATYTLSDGTTATPAYSVWAWRDSQNLASYSLLAKVTEQNKDQYQIGFTTTTADTSCYIYLGVPCKTGTPAANAEGKYKGIYAWTGNAVPGGYANFPWWTRIICDNNNNGQIIKIIPVGTEYPASDTDTNYGTSEYTIVMMHSDEKEGLAKFSHITEENMSEYQLAVPSCAVGGALFIERTIQANASNTKGFGLLYTYTDDYLNWISTDNEDQNLPNTEYWEYYTGSSSLDCYYDEMPWAVGLWDETPADEDPVAYATQDLYGAGIRTNLVTASLDDEGKPIYTRTTVEFLAKYMAQIMTVEEKTNGYYNTHHVMGVKMFDDTFTYVGPNAATATKDLAQVLRDKVWAANSYGAQGYKLGDYDTTKSKFDSDKLRTYEDVETWYDAAYFLLHNTWRDSASDDGSDGYGMPSKYHSLHLVETTNDDGEICYVFNAKYNDTIYSHDSGMIYNTSLNENYAKAYYNYSRSDTSDSNGAVETAYGVDLPAQRFDPLGPSGAKENLGYGMSGATYGHFGLVDRLEYYDETNYNLSLEGHAQFVYQYDADQYFTFTGDDDVYLYIAGTRVLDIGGAHGISEVTIRLNDVAKTLGLENGGTYNFDFFYMERHGTAANFGIETNIQIADASMHTEKQGFQNGVNTGYGGPVNGNNHVGYTFTLENNGTARIYNLTFDDPTLDVHFGYDEIRPYPVGQNVRTDKYPYAIETDLYLIYYNSAGDIVEYIAPNTGLTADTLKAYLKAGLEPGEKLGIYGIKYKIDANEWSDTDGDGIQEFINHVYTTATDMEDITPATKTLHGVADWKVVKMQHPYEAFRVYDWVHKAVSNDPADAANLTWKAPGDNGIPASNTVTVSKDYLIDEYLIDNVNITALTDAQKAAINIVLCTAAGNKDEYFLNPNVSKDAESGGITYTSTNVGKDTVFFVFDGVPTNDALYETLVFSYEVYTYGAVDNVYVLDYGLPVELAGNNFGFHTNDHLQLNENTRAMTTVVTGMVDADGKEIAAQAGTYGDFTWNAETKSLKYTPDAIINNTDEVYAKFRIVETDENGAAKEFSMYTGVEMVQKITTAPASVVYYEENFANNKEGGITFVDGAFGNWAQYETMKPVYDEDGKLTGYEPIAGLEQSPDQDMNYGSNFTDDNGTPDDPSDDIIYAYDQDKEGVLVGKDAEGNYQVGTDEDNKSATLEWGSHDELAENELKELNDYLAIRGGDSNGTVKELVINTTKQTEAMWFTFVGTGVEIIGRTTDDAFAVINVVVQKKDGDNWVNFRMKPVITQSIGGDQYQVPIISFTGLPKAEYRVSLKVAKSEGTTVDRMLYIDGVRIYGPLGDEEALEYYNPEEYKAQIIEVKQLIDDEQAIFCAASSGIENEEFKLVTGGTMVEQVNGETVLKKIESHDEYLRVGPNNELYLLGGSQDFNVLCFFIKEIPGYIDGARTLQIGAHRKADSDTLEYTSSVNMIYGSLNASMKDAKAGDANFYSVDTGTEMYYDIDIKELDKDEKLGGYIVMIGTNGTTPIGYTDTLALTNIKVAGYTISTVSQAIEDAKNQGQTVSTMSIFTEPIALMGAWLEAANKEPEIEELPVNENMSIEYAELIDDKVSSGNYAMATVKTNSYAQNVVVYDVQGNEVELIKCIRRRKNGAIYFDIAWEITGSRGEVQTYTIRVLDAEKNASVNTKTVAVTIV